LDGWIDRSKMGEFAPWVETMRSVVRPF